ncbi:hypothetical protein [Streptomyces sp. NPDC054834]
MTMPASSIGRPLGSRPARPLVTRRGQYQILAVAGALRALWPVGPACLGPGTGGLLLVMGVELGPIFCRGVFNPVCAAHASSAPRPTGPPARCPPGR